MCKFLSAIGLKNGDILCDPSIDSHEDIIQLHSLKESKMRNWVRIEFYPEDDADLIDLTKYELHIDDSNFDWIDEVKEKWIRKLKAKLRRIIITEDTFLLPSGTYILSGKVLINKLLYCRILNAGHSTIKHAGHSTIEDAGHSTIEDAWHSTIEDAGHSTIEHAWYSTIEDAGYSTIKHAGHSTIEDAGHSTIEHAWHSTIEDAGHSTIINKQNAKILK